MRSLVLLCVLIISTHSFSQEPLCTWGKPIPNEKPTHKLVEILASDNTGYYALREFVSGFDKYQWLEKYGKDFALVFSKEITLNKGVMGNSTYYRGLYSVNDKFMIVAEHWDKAKGSHELNIRWVSKEGEKSDDIQVLCKIAAVKAGNKGSFEIVFSDDNKKMAVLREHPFEKGANEKISISVYETATMKELWSKDITYKTLGSKANWNTISVANDGSTYVYKKIRTKRIYSYSLFSTDKQGARWTEYPLDFGAVFPEQFSFSFNAKQDFIACGMYKLKETAGSSFIVGRFYYRIDGMTKKLVVKSITPFAKDMLSDFLGAKDAAKEGYGINNLKIKQVLARSNGSILMVTEVNSYTASPVVGTTPIVYNYSHRAGSIAVLCINEDGGRAWYSSVIKRQEMRSQSKEKIWSSYVYFFKDDGLTIIWNNSNLNTATLPPYKWSGPDGATHINRREFSEKTRYTVFLAVIEPDGTSKFKAGKYGLPLFKMMAKGVFTMGLRSDLFYQEGNSLILYAELPSDSKRYKLGKIKL